MIRTINFGASLNLTATAALLSSGMISSAAAPSAVTDASWQKPAWLTDLSLGAKESFDDNVLLVSGQGMKPQSSWISSVSPKIGFDFTPLLGNQKTVEALTLSYVPDFFIYHEAPSESYNAQKFNNTVKASLGAFTFALDNAFLFNDGNRKAETYALSQAAPASNQNDKFRNFFAQVVPRERRQQIQDRNTTSLQYDWNQFFVRPTASLVYYGLDTYWHNTALTGYKGYQNYPDRYDVNGGADVGYKITPPLAVTLGYRYGHQYQQSFTPGLGLDTRNSSSDYQRLLLGLEGLPWSWLKVKLTGGPDFRDYNAEAYVNDRHTITYYGEAAVTAAISADQSVSFNFKQWEWLSSTGVVPFFESTYGLNYHWNATRQLGVDLGGKILEADFTGGNDDAGAAPSLRDDRQYTVSAGVTYAFTPHLSGGLTYAYDLGDSAINVPATLEPAYRDFEHQLVSLGVQYKF